MCEMRGKGCGGLEWSGGWKLMGEGDKLDGDCINGELWGG